MTSRAYDEPRFSFIDSSAWPSVQRLRDFWEHWFALMPPGPKKVSLAKGIRSTDDHKHLSHVAELYLFAVLARGGWEVEHEPLGAKGERRLDFLARRGDLAFYVECKVTGPGDQRLRLKDAIDEKASRYGRLDLPLLVATGRSEFQLPSQLDDALLGTRVWHVRPRRRTVDQRRRPDGVLLDRQGPRNVTMSAQLQVEVDMVNFVLDDRKSLLTHHWSPRLALPLGLFPFCTERSFGVYGRGVVTEPAETVSAYFGLPPGWPHFELDPHGLIDDADLERPAPRGVR